ncbi:hypothetical protein BC828DRAFT_224386 [Blastocladiella britannica]|nr:hypothetical protein BC828DRAFT_224386 [Blastocladiella britannica]
MSSRWPSLHHDRRPTSPPPVGGPPPAKRPRMDAFPAPSAALPADDDLFNDGDDELLHDPAAMALIDHQVMLSQQPAVTAAPGPASGPVSSHFHQVQQYGTAARAPHNGSGMVLSLPPGKQLPDGAHNITVRPHPHAFPASSHLQPPQWQQQQPVRPHVHPQQQQHVSPSSSGGNAAAEAEIQRLQALLLAKEGESILLRQTLAAAEAATRRAESEARERDRLRDEHFERDLTNARAEADALRSQQAFHEHNLRKQHWHASRITMSQAANTLVPGSPMTPRRGAGGMPLSSSGMLLATPSRARVPPPPPPPPLPPGYGSHSVANGGASPLAGRMRALRPPAPTPLWSSSSTRPPPPPPPPVQPPPSSPPPSLVTGGHTSPPPPPLPRVLEEPETVMVSVALSPIPAPEEETETPPAETASAESVQVQLEQLALDTVSRAARKRRPRRTRDDEVRSAPVPLHVASTLRRLTESLAHLDLDVTVRDRVVSAMGSPWNDSGAALSMLAHVLSLLVPVLATSLSASQQPPSPIEKNADLAVTAVGLTLELVASVARTQRADQSLLPTLDRILLSPPISPQHLISALHETIVTISTASLAWHGSHVTARSVPMYARPQAATTDRYDSQQQPHHSHHPDEVVPTLPDPLRRAIQHVPTLLTLIVDLATVARKYQDLIANVAAAYWHRREFEYLAKARDWPPATHPRLARWAALVMCSVGDAGPVLASLGNKMSVFSLVLRLTHAPPSLLSTDQNVDRIACHAPTAVAVFEAIGAAFSRYPAALAWHWMHVNHEVPRVVAAASAFAMAAQDSAPAVLSDDVLFSDDESRRPQQSAAIRAALTAAPTRDYWHACLAALVLLCRISERGPPMPQTAVTNHRTDTITAIPDTAATAARASPWSLADLIEASAAPAGNGKGSDGNGGGGGKRDRRSDAGSSSTTATAAAMAPTAPNLAAKLRLVRTAQWAKTALAMLLLPPPEQQQPPGDEDEVGTTDTAERVARRSARAALLQSQQRFGHAQRMHGATVDAMLTRLLADAQTMARQAGLLANE